MLGLPRLQLLVALVLGKFHNRIIFLDFLLPLSVLIHSLLVLRSNLGPRLMLHILLADAHFSRKFVLPRVLHDKFFYNLVLGILGGALVQVLVLRVCEALLVVEASCVLDTEVLRFYVLGEMVNSSWTGQLHRFLEKVV